MKNLTIALFTFLTYSLFGQLPQYVPNSDCSVWYPFSNNANDYSINGINATNNGATLTNDRFNNSNSAYLFNGNPSTYIATTHNINNLLDVGNGSYSLSVWFKTSSLDIQSIIHKRTMGGTQGTTNYHGYTLFVSNGLLTFDLEDENWVSTSVIGSNNYADGNWHNVIVVRDVVTDLITLYVDGVFEAENTDNTTVNNMSSNDLLIGKWRNVDDYSFNGSIDDIGIWKRALTTCEIQDLFNAQLNYNNGEIELNNNDLVSLTQGANYQWLDCENNFSDINGETNQIFTPSVNGTYSVEVNLNGCIVVSECLIFNTTQIQELENGNKEIHKIIDMNGKEVKRTTNTPLIFIYTDGTTQSVYIIE
jgi:hypothetical protein